MNIEVVARIRPPGRGEVTSINISGTRVESSNGTGHIFSTVYKPHILTYDIYRESFLPLLDPFVAGYNVCVLAFGETGSGKSYTLAGERSAKAGLVPLLINGLFLKLKEQREKENKLQVQQGIEGQVVAQCFQVYNEKVSDLFISPPYEGRVAEITEDAINGVIVRNITKKHISDAAECTALFRQAMESRTHAQTDYGQTDNRSAVFFTLDLFREKSEVFHSRLLIAELPGAEKLAEDPTQLRMREGPSLNRPILAFRHLVSSLAASPTATRVINYSDSKLTLLLKDALGGNCKTKVIVNLKATETPFLSTVLTLSGQLAQILNYPILNGNMAQQLLTQYRAVIINLQEQLTLSGRRVGDTSMSKVQEYKDQLAKVSNENVKLQEGREQLYHRIIELEAKYTEATTSWKQLSSKLELSDEEKLQIYKNLVDLQLENNRIIEETAADKYELTNRILSLENQVSEFETAHDRNKRAADQTNEELGVLQNEHGELSDEYLVLKTNHIHITNELQNEMSRNEELGLELVRLSSLKDRLQKDKETVEIETMQEYYSQLRKLASKFSRGSLREKNDMSKSLVSLRSENLQLEKQLLLSSNAKDGMVDVLKNEHHKELSRLADKINDLKMKLKQAQASQRESQRRLAGQSAELITTQADKRRVEEQNDKLDQQLKEVSAEYSNRLQQYIHDISVYCGQMSGQQVSLESLQAYIDAMVRKVRDAQEHRVLTLEERVKTLKAAIAELSKKHGKLLSLHSVLRFDVESSRGTRIDENDTYLPTEEELENAQTLEVRKLTTKLCKYEQEIKDLKQQLSVATTKQKKIQDGLWMHSETTKDHSKHLVSDSSNINWNQLRKHLREFTLNTQQELESERASLLTRCIIAEEQITGLQEYIDTQLKRYLQEIARLKKKLGESERANSADAAIVSNNYGALLGKRWGK